jgi:hypothetical protein
MAPKGIVIQITGDGASAAKALDLVDAHLRETASQAKGAGSEIAESMRAVQDALGSIGLTVGVGEAIAKMKEMVAASVDLGMELGHASKETGISAENLSVLKYASDVTGVSFEALTKGMGRMSKAMLEAEEGKKASIQSFNRLGISQKQVSDHANDMLGMLGLVADRFQTLPDGPQKAAVAISLFGKAGMQLIPFLDEGSAGIEKLTAETKSLGLMLDEQGIAKLEEMHKTEVQLEAATQGLALSLTSALGPALMGAAELIEKAEGALRQWLSSENAVASGIRELLNMQHGNEGNGSGVKLPENLAGLQGADLDAARVRAAQARDAAKQKLDALEEAQKNEGGSIKDFNTKKLALEKEYFDQDKTMYAAMYKDQQDAVGQAQAQLAAAQKNHGMLGSIFGDSDLDAAKQKLAESKQVLGELGTSMAAADAKLSDLGKSNKGLTLQDQSEKGPKTKGDNKVAEQATALAEANATAEAAAQKSADEVLLAQMEADHKLFLTSDANYYREKLILQKDAIDAEEAALRTRITDLQALQTRQHGDKKLTRDKSGNSAEEEKTATQIVQLNQQINDLEGKRATLNVNASLAAQERADSVHLSSLKAAAEMEEHTNSGIQARLALMKQEQQLAMQKTKAQGGDTQGLAALQKQEQELLQIEDIERQINQVKEEGALQAAALKDREEKDPSQRKAATKELNALNKETAATLQDLTAQYDALAATLGGDFLQKAAAQNAELAKLNTPDKKQDMQPYKTLGEGFTTMAEQMSRAVGTGREGFHKMCMSMEQDLVELAVKFAAQQWLAPFMSSLGLGMGGGSGGGSGFSGGAINMPVSAYAEGGDYGAGPRIIGENGPELDFPKGPGTILPNDAFQNLSRSGGGGVPNVTMNVTNASSQPVTARQTGTSMDSDMKNFVIHTILEDHANGGPISAAQQGSS